MTGATVILKYENLRFTGSFNGLDHLLSTSVRRVVFRVKNYREKVKGKRLKGEKIAFYLSPFPFNQPQPDSL